MAAVRLLRGRIFSQFENELVPSWERGIHYVILALPSSLFLMQQQKNHQKMYRNKTGKQTFFCKQTRLAIKNHQFFEPNAHSVKG